METEEDEDLQSDFDLCIICQKKSAEKCIDPSQNSDQKVLGQGYSSLATQFKEFNSIGALRCPRLKKMQNDHQDNLDTYMRLMGVKWHKTCKLNYSKSRLKREIEKTSIRSNIKECDPPSDVMSDLVEWMKNEREKKKPLCHFFLSDICRKFLSHAEEHSDSNSTRIKNELLQKIPQLRDFKSGKEVILVFEEDIGPALVSSAAARSGVQLMDLAAKKLRKELQDHQVEPFQNKFDQKSMKGGAPESIVMFLNKLLRGNAQGHSLAADTIAQLIRFNFLKRDVSEKKAAVYTRHEESSETPLAIYIGLLIHAQHRDRQLIDDLSKLGVCIGYHRVLTISAALGNAGIEEFMRCNVVFPLNMSPGIFTTSQLDNIDHDPSSTSAVSSFHGTGISLLQHPDTAEASNVLVPTSMASKTSKKVASLPTQYTEVLPFSLPSKTVTLPDANISDLRNKKEDVDEAILGEYHWLNNVCSLLKVNQSEVPQSFSWSAYHSKNSNDENIVMTKTGLLPLFRESAHTIAMIKHGADVISKATEFLNPGQCPVIHVDQPLFALLKQLQYSYPQRYGEEKLVVMLGGLHIEMVIMRVLGDLLEGSGWTQMINEAGITTEGRAEALLRGNNVTRCRHAHEVTAACLYILQQEAYEEYMLDKRSNDPEMMYMMTFEEWKSNMQKHHPQFCYWDKVLELELIALMFVRAVRTSDFKMYTTSLIQIIPYIFSFDHINYMRWLPVHIKDMKELSVKQPLVYDEFMKGHFTAKKTLHSFSAIAEDQSHEQNNAKVKGNGGAVGLTENEQALRRWMVAGPEVCRVIEEFQGLVNSSKEPTSDSHHSDTPGKQKRFRSDIENLLTVLRENGSPYSDESQDLFTLDTKIIASEKSIENLKNLHSLGEGQFSKYVEERLVKRTVPFEQKLTKNRISIFNDRGKKTAEKDKNLDIKILKKDELLFRKMLIACQNREADMVHFFSHENQPYPPSLSQNGRLRQCNKSDLLAILESLVDKTETEAQMANHVTVLDGSFVVQYLRPIDCKTFGEYASKVFIPHVQKSLTQSKRLDIVWDIYRELTIKAQTREKRGTGQRRKIESSSVVPKDWQSFLRNSDNKTELYAFLSNSVLSLLELKDKEVIVNHDNVSLSSDFSKDMREFDNCDHEEADSRIFSHIAQALACGYDSFSIRTGDTDVVVIAISIACKLTGIKQLIVNFGTGQNFRKINVGNISKVLGNSVSRVLPLFHSFTGCDSVSSFSGRGKKSAWSTWNLCPELTKAFLTIMESPASFNDREVFDVIERYVVLLFDRTSNVKNVDESRRKLFSQRASLENIPPTKAALLEHTRRAVFQGRITKTLHDIKCNIYLGVHVWGHPEDMVLNLPKESEWGWEEREGVLVPVWSTLPDLWKSAKELIHCNCKSSVNICGRRCKCKMADPPLPCTALCFCEGDCSQ